MDKSKDEELLTNAFFSYTSQRVEAAKQANREFVHYTSSESALSIINNREIWLRNATTMNDYAEIAHGEACLRYCLYDNDDTVRRSRKILDSLVEGLHDHAIRYLDGSTLMRRVFTYLLSFSEHGPEHIAPEVPDIESELGRLSMWRADGSSGGVALIFRGQAFWDPNPHIPVYASPVFYGSPVAFAQEYHKMLTFIEGNCDQLKLISPDDIKKNFELYLHFASLFAKHPGFVDEREWRLTYSADPESEHSSDDDFNAANTIQRSFVTINGLPQRIYKIPFKDFGEHGSTALPVILRSAIVGPSPFPNVTAHALYMALIRAGMPTEKPFLAISNIPIRT